MYNYKYIQLWCKILYITQCNMLYSTQCNKCCTTKNCGDTRCCDRPSLLPLHSGPWRRRKLSTDFANVCPAKTSLSVHCPEWKSGVWHTSLLKCPGTLKTRLRHSAVMAVTEDKQCLCCEYFYKRHRCVWFFKGTFKGYFPFLSSRRCLALNLLQLRFVSPICCSNAFPPIPPFLFQLQWCHCPVHFSEALVKADLREASVEGDLSEASLKADLSALQWSFSWKMTSVRTKSLKWDFLRCRPQPNSTLACNIRSVAKFPPNFWITPLVSSCPIKYQNWLYIKLSHLWFHLLQLRLYRLTVAVRNRVQTLCGVCSSRLRKPRWEIVTWEQSKLHKVRNNEEKSIQPAHWHRGYHVAAPAGWRREHVASFSTLPGQPGFCQFG